jgi:hypothetical protein
MVAETNRTIPWHGGCRVLLRTALIVILPLCCIGCSDQLYLRASEAFREPSEPEGPSADAQLVQRQKVCVKTCKEYTWRRQQYGAPQQRWGHEYRWSVGRELDGTILKGSELNRRMSSHQYNANSTYVVVFWPGEVRILELDSFPGSIPAHGVWATDQYGGRWKVASATACW